MEKNIPYYKCCPAKRQSKRIINCTLEAQGLFANICDFYWVNMGNLNIEFVNERFPNNGKDIENLINKKIIKITEGEITISFLDIQIESFTNISKKRADSGRKGGVRRQAIAKQVLNNAKQLPIYREKREERREKRKETRKEKNIKKELTNFERTFEDFKDMRKQIKKPLTLNSEKLIISKLKRLSESEDEQIKILEQSIMGCYQGVFEVNRLNQPSKKKGLREYYGDCNISTKNNT